MQWLVGVPNEVERAIVAEGASGRVEIDAALPNQPSQRLHDLQVGQMHGMQRVDRVGDPLGDSAAEGRVEDQLDQADASSTIIARRARLE